MYVIIVVSALSAGVDGLWRIKAGPLSACVLCVHCVFVCVYVYMSGS